MRPSPAHYWVLLSLFYRICSHRAGSVVQTWASAWKRRCNCKSTSLARSGDLVGQTLGNCQIEALLGQGGFGAVYRARQPHLDRLVAIKVVLAAISNTDAQKRHELELRFEREAQAVARLDHPHILALYEYQSQPLPYLVMPYVAGGSLADEMKSSGHRPLPVNGVAIILNQVASALDSAHQHPLIHRD